MNRDGVRVPRVLVTDDEEGVRWTLKALMKEEGFEPLEAEDGETALKIMRQELVDAVILDIRLPGMDGMEVLKEVRKSDLHTPVIMITGYGSIEQAVEAANVGACDFLTKPFDNDQVVLAVRRALMDRALWKQGEAASAFRDGSHPLCETMGSSEPVARLAEQVDRVAHTNLTVMITGETGVGKELVARTIHQRSRRSSSVFVAVDCGSLPAGLVENQLFGHQKGAYTGAHRATPGKFEAASGGTLFLDEIGNLPATAQATLLRVLQEKAVCRVGGLEPIPVNVHLLVATNQDVRSLVQAGRFRLDLYHRLAEFELAVPPLRDRREDLPFLAQRFLDEANGECGSQIKGLRPQALSMLRAYDWPGNVRELRNVIRRAVILADAFIEPSHLAPLGMPGGVGLAGSEVEAQSEDGLSLKQIARRAARKAERQALTKVLKHTGGNKAKAARILHVDYKTLHSKVKKYGISC